MEKTKISLEEIIKQHSSWTYQEVYNYIKSKIESGQMKEIKNSGLNGKRPILYNSYWKYNEDIDYSIYLDEIRFKLHASINTTYYMNNVDKYIENRNNILKLSNHLQKKSSSYMKNPATNSNKSMYSKDAETINERSFEIFQREKYLKNEGGQTLLKQLGIDKAMLDYYDTTEPLAYYSHHKQTPQNILIVENKDTFYSMRKHLIEGNRTIFGLEIGTIIYGSGKAVFNSFSDFANAVEPYFSDIDNKLYYFGDIDYEGILIYERFCQTVNIEIKAFTNGYEIMLYKAENIGIDLMPTTKKGQNKNITDLFFKQFNNRFVIKIKKLLEEGRYIPQEIVNSNDY